MSAPLDFQPNAPGPTSVAATFFHARNRRREAILVRDVVALCSAARTVVSGSVASYVNEAARLPDLSLPSPVLRDPAALAALRNVQGLCAQVGEFESPTIAGGAAPPNPLSEAIGDSPTSRELDSEGSVAGSVIDLGDSAIITERLAVRRVGADTEQLQAGGASGAAATQPAGQPGDSAPAPAAVVASSPGGPPNIALLILGGLALAAVTRG